MDDDDFDKEKFCEINFVNEFKWLIRDVNGFGSSAWM